MSSAPSFARITDAARVSPPVLALVLGSGLGALAKHLTSSVSVAFPEVPGLVPTSVVGHIGCLTLGQWICKTVLIFEGRLHLYEGHTDHVVSMPVAIASVLGARVMVFTNAAGGIHDALTPGSLMAVRDHIEWNRPHEWQHSALGGIGPNRPSPYSARLLQMLARAAATTEIHLREGIYASVTGPNYETPAEIRALRTYGADAVGMSTTTEVLAAQNLGLECAALSCITNRAAGLGSGPISHEDVLASAARQSERLTMLLEEFLRML